MFKFIEVFNNFLLARTLRRNCNATPELMLLYFILVVDYVWCFFFLHRGKCRIFSCPLQVSCCNLFRNLRYSTFSRWLVWLLALNLYIDSENNHEPVSFDEVFLFMALVWFGNAVLVFAPNCSKFMAFLWPAYHWSTLLPTVHHMPVHIHCNKGCLVPCDVWNKDASRV